MNNSIHNTNIARHHADMRGACVHGSSVPGIRIGRYACGSSIYIFIFALIASCGCGPKQDNKTPAAPPDHQTDIGEQNIVLENDIEAPKENDIEAPEQEIASAGHDDAGPETQAAAEDGLHDETKAAESRGLEPLTSEQRDIIGKITWDEEPEILYAVEEQNIGRHYLVSDEKHPYLYKQSIENKGGTYMGVGTGQGYLYIGWQKPEFGILFDYDPMVVELHQLVLGFIGICGDAECLRSHFNDAKKGLAWIQGDEGTKAGLNTRHMTGRFKQLRKAILKSLNRLRDDPNKTMMNDAETYQYVRDMVTGGRLITVRADLLGKTGMKSISEGLKSLDAKVTTLYLSNAEQYWNYTEEFKQNMLSLPFADDALIMRTTASYPQNGDYRYSIQPAQIFVEWMQRKRTRTVKQMLKKVRIRDEEFPFVLDDIAPPEGGK